MLIGATYLLSFADRNPWLMSLSFSGFAWFVISLLLTHRTLQQLGIASDGKITNNSGDSKYGLRIDGVEIPEIAPWGSLRVRLNPQQRRFRVSTFTPTGLFYSWTFQRSTHAHSSDLGDSLPWSRGASPV